MSSSNLVRLGYKKETAYGVTPVAVKATKVLQAITYMAKSGGEPGNLLSIEYLDSASAGAEVATVQGKKISVAIASGVSTATQVLAAINASAPVLALVTASITGTASSTQTAAAETFFINGVGGFKVARFTGEKFSGTPDTTESAQIRTDRQSSGQIVTGLSVTGGYNFEVAKEKALEDFMESAMFNSWVTSALKTVALQLNVSTRKLIRTTGSFISDGVKVGDFLQLNGFASSANNTQVQALIVTALEITIAFPSGVTSQSGGASYQVCDKLSIGITKNSLTVEKTFLDLTNKALIYRGLLVSEMELNIEYGSLVTGSFTTMGSDYVAADDATEFASYQEYFSDSATSNTMNGSVDMPFVATDVTGSWAQDAFCLQNLKLSLNNNLTVQNCIGKAAPEDYSVGTAQISADLSSYLKDGNWGMLARKLSQAPFALGYQIKNLDGWYGFFIPALQVSFDDPQSGGQNQEISMEMSGTAKVGANGESALTIYRAPTA